MNVYLNYLKGAVKLCLSYIEKDTWDKIKVALLKALEAFIKVLWNEIKDTVREQALLALQTAKTYYEAEQVKIKKSELISQVVESLKLPIIAKPFKGLLKSYINKQVEKIFQEAYYKGYEFLTD